MMKHAIRLSLFSALLGVLAIGSGCAPKKRTAKQLNALEAQVGVLTDELTRLDQAIQETRGGVQAQASQGQQWAAAPSGEGSSSVYRTPSGFELPSANIQKALQSAGYYQGAIDGKIGPATKQAVKAFQRDNSLEADGVVGRRTWDKLKVYLGTAVK